MAARFGQLLSVRSRLVEEVITYLDDLAKRAAALPTYYPAHLSSSAAGTTRFDEIRQIVQVVEDRSGFER